MSRAYTSDRPGNASGGWVAILLAGLCVAGLLLTASAAAQEPAVDTETPAPTAEERQAAEREQARILALGRELDERQRAIEDMQGDFGIYDQSLVEAHSDLGALLVELEDYPAAVRAYSDALQLSRINSGLYSEDQLPVIDSLIAAQSAQDEWQEVDDLEELKLHIAMRLYAPGQELYLASAERYGQWKLRTLKENLLQQSSRSRINTARELSDFYENVIYLSESSDMERARLTALILDKTETDLSLARSIAITPFTAFEGTVSRYVTETRCQSARNAQGELVRQCYNVQVENPRYRQSQRDAKQFELNRHTRDVTRSLERLRSIRQETTLSAADEQALDRHIAELETESQDILRASRNRRLF